jgi:hypothetical protein
VNARQCLPVLAVVLALAGCKSDPVLPAAEDVASEVAPQPPPGPASVRFLQAAPDLGPVQLRMDYDMVSAAANAMAMPPVPVAFDAPPGSRTFKVERHADAAATVLAELAVVLEGDRHYLLVLSDAKEDKGVLRLLPDDQQAEAGADQALVRVVNATAGGGPTDVRLTPGWSFANVGAGRGTAYLARKAGTVKLLGVAGLDATATPVYQRDELMIEPAHRYIVVLTSKAVPTGDKKVVWIVDEAPPVVEEKP